MSGTSGEFEGGFQKADAVAEGTYGNPTICHQCLESHGLVAEWSSDGGLTVWASTQAVDGTAEALGTHFRGKGVDLPDSKVKCITHYMGGGYGSKFGPDIQGVVAAELALKTKAPVKMMLNREEEIIAAGNRPSVYGKVKIAGKKDGTVTAYQVDCHGSPGVGRGATVNFGLLPYVYTFQFDRKHQVVRLNAGALRAMRAPGHPQNCYMTESAVDDLAAKLGIDPLVIRLKNLPQNDPEAMKNAPTSFPALRHTIYTREIEIAVQKSGWKEKWHPPGKGPKKGPWQHGIGMALHTWGGQASPRTNDCTVVIAADGSVTASTSSQDLGTGQRTVTPIVVAEVLGLEIPQITTEWGESQLGTSSGSGGSTTCPSQAPAALIAATAARDELFKKIAGKLGAEPQNLTVEGGKVVDTARKMSWEWKQACARLGTEQARGMGTWTFAMSNEAENKNVSSSGVGGVQVAEVWVDVETGQVRCEQIVAVQDCGMIINLLGCESQVAGGVIMGANLALYEERIMDRTTGRQVNPDMEFYKLAGIKDIPRIIVEMMDMPERGVIGIGEPPTISTHAAIGNAVHNALGVRVGETPFSPERVLAALAKS
jgi:xanthine dehydrogenase YagR molybdenum-binding subunit